MAPGIEQDAFLAACFQNLKEKPQPDFDKVATQTGMSVGGAKNKFRDMMKRMGFDADGKRTVNDNNKDDKKLAAKPKTPKKEPAAKSGTKRKASTAKKEEVPSTSDAEEEIIGVAEDKVGDDDATSSESEESPKKKRQVAKAKAAGTKAETAENAEQGDSDAKVEAPATIQKEAKVVAVRKDAAAKKVEKDIEMVDADAGSEEKKPATKGRGRPKTVKAKKDAEEEKEDTGSGADEMTEAGKKATAKARGKNAKAKKDTDIKKAEKEKDISDVEVELVAPRKGRHSRKPSATKPNTANKVEIRVPVRPATKAKEEPAEAANNKMDQDDDEKPAEDKSGEKAEAEDEA